MATIKYKRDVTSPKDRAGQAGQTRSDLPDYAIEDLVHDGYVEIIEPADEIPQTKSAATKKTGVHQHEPDKSSRPQRPEKPV